MNFKELITKRHTSKDYLENVTITDEDLKDILEASNLAPTALGQDPTRVLYLREQSTKDEMSAFFAPANQPKVKNSAATFIYIGETPSALLANDNALLKQNQWYTNFDDEGENARFNGGVNWVKNPASRSDTYDIIAAANKSSYLTLAATEKGFSSTIMAGLNFDEFEGHLREKKLILEGERIVLAVVIGREDPNSEVNKILGSRKLRTKLEDFAKEIK